MKTLKLCVSDLVCNSCFIETCGCECMARVVEIVTDDEVEEDAV